MVPRPLFFFFFSSFQVMAGWLVLILLGNNPGTCLHHAIKGLTGALGAQLVGPSERHLLPLQIATCAAG